MGDQGRDRQLVLHHGPQGQRRPQGSLLDPVVYKARVDHLQAVVVPAGDVHGDLLGDPTVEDHDPVVFDRRGAEVDGVRRTGHVDDNVRPLAVREIQHRLEGVLLRPVHRVVEFFSGID